MVQFKATIKRFKSKGEKTGWTYIDVPAAIANQLQPGNKKGFRVKGKVDHYNFSMVALLPMGGGDFIMTLNAEFRKNLRKPPGSEVLVKMEVDNREIEPPAELVECLQDEPEALAYFKSLPKGHQNYFSNWIRSAKTEPTKAKRIAAALNAFINKWDYGQMIRSMKKDVF
jgi:Uncharacterized protein conserved in bacteria